MCVEYGSNGRCVCRRLWRLSGRTKALQRVRHGLVLHHVDEAAAQAEVGEDEEHVLQDVVDAAHLLEHGKNMSRSVCNCVAFTIH